MEQFINFISFVAVGFGIALFIKVWIMTNNVEKIREMLLEHFEDSPKDFPEYSQCVYSTDQGTFVSITPEDLKADRIHPGDSIYLPALADTPRCWSIKSIDYETNEIECVYTDSGIEFFEGYYPIKDVYIKTDKYNLRK